ncbi:MAG: hypothetical protein IJ048_12275, partial [Clostridia bacterium]|nr:hypothetical protein [Clostridia bacterium]
ALAVMLALAVLAGGAIWYYTYGMIYEREMPSSWYDVTLSRLESGAVVATMRMNRKVNPCEGVGAVRSGQRSVWHLFMGYFPLDYQTNRTRDYTIMAAVYDSADALERIECGRDNAVIWRRGEEIAPASPEMEAYYRALAELEAFEEETTRRHMIEKAERGDYNSSFYELTDEEEAEGQKLANAVSAAKGEVSEWGAGEADVTRGIQDSMPAQNNLFNLDSLRR